MFGWFSKKVEKGEFEHHKGIVQTALNSVKQDMDSVTKWIKHLDSQDSEIKSDVERVAEDIASIKEELDEIKKLVSEPQQVKIEPVFKHRQTAVYKQTAVEAVQTAVQTAVQAGFFTKLSTSEKAIVGILANTDMKLSYEDLSAMLGKDTATIRGQVNSVKTKCAGVIEEMIEKNGKKRLFVPEKIKDLLLKRARVGMRAKRRENEGK